jgi:hypothetical protein
VKFLGLVSKFLYVTSSVTEIPCRGRGGIVGTLCHVIIFYIFSVLINLNVTAYTGSNTFGQQPDLCKSDAILKQNEGKAFSLASAFVPTCTADRVSWHMVKIHGKSRCQPFKG